MIVDVETLDRVLEILATGENPGTVEIQLNDLEVVYITEKILNLPTRLTENQRIRIGEKILKEIWSDDIKGEIQSVRW